MYTFTCVFISPLLSYTYSRHAPAVPCRVACVHKTQGRGGEKGPRWGLVYEYIYIYIYLHVYFYTSIRKKYKLREKKRINRHLPKHIHWEPSGCAWRWQM